MYSYLSLDNYPVHHTDSYFLNICCNIVFSSTPFPSSSFFLVGSPVRIVKLLIIYSILSEDIPIQPTRFNYRLCTIFSSDCLHNNTFKYHVFAPMGRFQLELIYLHFPPSFHQTVKYNLFAPMEGRWKIKVN